MAIHLTSGAWGALTLTLAVTVSAQRSPAASPQAVSFAAALQSAVDHHDRAAMASLVRYPAIVMVAGLQVPVADPQALMKLYDQVFTPELRCAIDRTGVALEARDGASLAGGAIWAQRTGDRFKIARIIVPAMTTPTRRSPPRRVAFADPKYPAQFSGLLARDESDAYVIPLRKGQTVHAWIEGFRGHDAVVRGLGGQTGPDGRAWARTANETADYRFEVARLAPYCDPSLVYVLSVTVQ